jgi:outer membrane protein assembly factor BamB
MKLNWKAWFAVAVLVGFFPAVLFAADQWPQWRGPQRDGHSPDTGLLKQWPAGGPKLLWKTGGLGIGYTNVSVDADHIYAMGDRDDGCYAIALSRTNGKPKWIVKVGKSGAPGWGGFAGPRCTPTVADGLVYAVGQYGEVACINAETAEVVWRKDYAKDFGSQLPQWGYCAMPLVDGDRVILAPGSPRGNLVALNKKTGELIWQSKEFTDSIHYSSPIVVEIGGVRQYIQLTETSVAGIAADDGRMLWRAARHGQTAVIPTPICRDGYVYVTSGYGAGCNLFKVTTADGKWSVDQVYENKVMTDHHGGVILVDKYLYGYSDGKGWVCQDFATGKAVWQEKRKLGKGSLVYADGMLYLRAEGDKGTVALIEATPKGYREKGRFDQPERSDKNSWPHPVIIGGRLYLRDQDVLLCYDVRNE